MKENAFLIIPYAIMEIDELKLSEKIVLCEVISLSKNRGYCYASNRFISKRTGVSPSKVSQAVSELRKKGYIITEKSDEQQRRIIISKDRFKANTLSVFNYAKSDSPISKSDSALTNRNSPLANSATNKKRNNTNYNNNYKERRKRDFYYQSEPSYDINELMKIK